MSIANLTPGELFVDQFGFKQEPETVMRYAAFLRAEAALSDQPVIDLCKIYDHFSISSPRLAPLRGQQGMLIESDTDMGTILINEDDPRVRRRFSEAHELMEYLFKVLPARRGVFGVGAGNFKYRAKESLCNVGAAELLMPRSTFAPHVHRLGVSFATARHLATLYDVSVTACLVQMVFVATGRHAVVLWRMKLKPTEIRRLAQIQAQMPLLGELRHYRPMERLRVEWAICGTGGDFVPKDKSVEEDSLIYAAWRDGVFTQGESRLSLGRMRGNTCARPILLIPVQGGWYCH